MGTRFENFSIGRALAQILNIKGLENQPNELATDLVQPTVDVMNVLGRAIPNAGEGLPMITESGNNALAGSTFYRTPIIWTGTLNNPFAAVAGQAYRIDSMSGYLKFDAAGAAAFNGKKLGIRLVLEDTGDSVQEYPIIVDWPAITVSTGRIDYWWALHGYNNDGGPAKSGSPWNGRVFIHPGSGVGDIIGLRLIITSIDGTAFPANTVWNVKTTGRRSTNGIAPLP